MRSGLHLSFESIYYQKGWNSHNGLIGFVIMYELN